MTLYEMKEYANAIILIEKAYNNHKKKLGEQHPNTQLIKRGLYFARSNQEQEN